VNTVGEGPRSNEVSSTPQTATVPGAPTLAATGGNAVVHLSWTVPADGGSPITGYGLYRGTASGAETLLTTVGAGASFDDTTVTNGTTYFYEVTALNAVGEGSRSNEASSTPQTAPTTPGSPKLSGSPGNAVVHLTWTVPGDGGSPITGYTVYRGTASGGETMLTTLAAVTSFDDTTVTNGTTYFYQVTALNAAGEGSRSNEISKVPKAPVLPGAPTLSAQPRFGGGITLTWAAPPNGGCALTGYRIYRSTSSGAETFDVAVGKVTSYADKGTTTGTVYYYRISAVNCVGEGPLSNEASAQAA
jgi:fibronectin type 3 domain-containing protein